MSLGDASLRLQNSCATFLWAPNIRLQDRRVGGLVWLMLKLEGGS